MEMYYDHADSQNIYESMCRWAESLEEVMSKVAYDEIMRLHEMLNKAGIPHRVYPWIDGYQIVYSIRNKRVCSVIENEFSSGGKDDLLEIMGLVHVDEYEKYLIGLGLGAGFSKKYSVKGMMTAEEVYERIKSHWELHKYEHIKHIRRM